MQEIRFMILACLLSLTAAFSAIGAPALANTTTESSTSGQFVKYDTDAVSFFYAYGGTIRGIVRQYIRNLPRTTNPDVLRRRNDELVESFEIRSEAYPFVLRSYESVISRRTLNADGIYEIVIFCAGESEQKRYNRLTNPIVVTVSSSGLGNIRRSQFLCSAQNL
jgi:hypothetical protein